MLHIAIGIISILLGIFGIMRNWYMFIDIISVIIPIALITFGVIALLAGIRGLKKSK